MEIIVTNAVFELFVYFLFLLIMFITSRKIWKIIKEDILREP